MPKEIRHLKIREISLVDDPGNPLALLEIVKAKGEFSPCADCSGNVAKVCKANGKCMAGAINKVAEQLEELGPLLAVDKGKSGAFLDIIAALAAAQSGNLDMDIEDLTKNLEKAEGEIAALTKAKEELEKTKTTLEATVKTQADTITKMKGEVDVLKSDIAKAKIAAGDKTAEEDVLKNLDPATREIVQKARSEAAAATEEITKLREKAETAEAIEKAKGYVPAGTTADKLGPIMLRISKGKATPEDVTELERVLKSAAEVAKSNQLFKSAGSRELLGDDPEAVLKAKADEIKKAKPDLTDAQAYAQAVDQNPALYNEYIAKRRAA